MKSWKLSALGIGGIFFQLCQTPVYAEWVTNGPGKHYGTAPEACAGAGQDLQKILSAYGATVAVTSIIYTTVRDYYVPGVTQAAYCKYSISGGKYSQPVESAVFIFAICGEGVPPSLDTPSGCASLEPTTPIHIWRNGKDITNTTQQVAAGEQIALSASYTLPPSNNIQKQSWSVAPTTAVVGGYEIAADYSVGKVVEASLNKQTAVLYFIDSGKSRSITFSYTLDNGQQASAQAVFDVFGPTSAAIVTTNYKTIKVNGPLLEFGDFTLSPSGKLIGTPGIVFKASAVKPPGYEGAFWWVQLLETESTILTSRQRPIVCQDGEALDTSYPFDTGPTTSDGPNLALGKTYVEESKQMSARMFLMWRSARPGAIPVPLAYVRWGWNGEAHLDSGQAWSIVPAKSSAWNEDSRVVNVFPEWKEIRGNSNCPP